MQVRPNVGDVESVEIEALLTAILKRYGYDFRQYARASLARRVRNATEEESIPSISALQELIVRDPQAMQRLLFRLSVHVTSMFRDAGFYRTFRNDIVPWLRTYPFVRIWHAGCATGEEVYSTAIVLQEEGLYDRVRIYATDMSDEVLQRAKKGIYSLDAIRRYTLGYHRSGGTRDFSSYYVADQENAMMNESLRKNVLFSLHNLVSDGSFNEFHLVLCRNVMIYFDEELRNRALALFDGSLVRGGFLAVGGKETLRFTPLSDRYEELALSSHVYRRMR